MGNAFNAMAGILAAAIFTLIAAIHAYWALGGLWPGHDPDSLARIVVGGQPGMRMPGVVATWTVVGVLTGAALTVLGASGIIVLPMTQSLLRLAAYAGAGVLLLRGLEGFVDTRIRPTTVGSPFARLNVRFYSPLCLMLAGLTYAAAAL